MVMQAQERESSQFVPRKRSVKVREAYKILPEIITCEELISNGVCNNVVTARVTLMRWLADGLIEKMDDKGQYKKKYSEIPI